jgi:NAD(P)H-dependent FMN reductase
MYQLKVIIASTRPGRKGIHVADWFMEAVKKYNDFEVEVLDLAKINLPFLDEPKHPKLQQYEHEHTKDWSSKIDSAEAFIAIVPEYNYGMPPTLANAIDFVYKEWNYKPIGFVSYGGISGGTRSVQMCKEIMSTVKLVPLTEAVNLPFFEKKIDEKGQFHSDELIDNAVHLMMSELLKWTIALKPMRG